MSLMLQGFPPGQPVLRLSDKGPPTGLEPVAAVEESKKLHGLAPPQPGNRRFGANSLLRLPSSSAEAPRRAAEQPGCCMPQAVKKEKCAQSRAGLRVVERV